MSPLSHLLAATAVVIVASCPAAASSIIVNGSFETVTSSMPSSGELPAGSTAIVGWTVFGTSTANNVVDWIGPGGGGPQWLVPDGTHAVDLDGRSSLYGGVEQSFATVAGALYSVLFDLSGNPGDSTNLGLPLVKTVRVSAAGTSQDYSFNSAGLATTTLVWQPNTFSFAATSNLTTLRFMSLTGSYNSYGALIDNVRVEALAPVPEASSAALLCGGLLAIVGVQCRRVRRPNSK